MQRKAYISAQQKFGRWTALEGGTSKDKVPCECECGARRTVFATSLVHGTSKSCGCLRRELAAERMATNRPAGSTAHGQSRPPSPTYLSWRAMIQRTSYTKDTAWKYYGARGIVVCDRWNPAKGGGFENFLTDMGERPEGRTLDRVDVEGHYTPENCRWATAAEQRRNRRDPVREGLA